MRRRLQDAENKLQKGGAPPRKPAPERAGFLFWMSDPISGILGRLLWHSFFPLAAGSTAILERIAVFIVILAAIRALCAPVNNKA
jgi:hypothetical protein